MPAEFLSNREYHAQRKRDAMTAAKIEQEKNRDHEMEQCVIAYHAYRVAGGGDKFESFRMQWIKDKPEPSHGG